MQENKASLLHEAKNFQTIRILNIFNDTGKEIRAEEHIEYLSNLLFDRINRFDEFQFYIDGFFLIKAAYYLNRISYQRKVEKGEIVPIRFDEPAISHPLYILFTSAFNEGIDKEFRNAIQVVGENIDYRLEPISYYLYNPMKFNKNYLLKHEELLKKRFALMFFQIKDANLIQSLTDEDKLFDPNFFNKESSHLRKFEIVSYGILKGDIEGFILFDIKITEEINFLQFLLDSETNTPIGKYCPLTVFFCEWEKKFSNTKKLNQLKEISNNHSK